MCFSYINILYSYTITILDLPKSAVIPSSSIEETREAQEHIEKDVKEDEKSCSSIAQDKRKWGRRLTEDLHLTWSYRDCKIQ